MITNKLVIKNVGAREHQHVHISNNCIRLSDARAHYAIFHNALLNTVFIFISDQKQVWDLDESYTALFCVDRRLDLLSLNINRYLVIGKVDATIERHSTFPMKMCLSSTKGAIVRAYVSGRVKINVSARQHSHMSICGSARVIRVYILEESSRLNLTEFEGRVEGDKDRVHRDSMHCRQRYPECVETSRERHVRENISVPKETLVNAEEEDACKACYTYKANIVFIPCGHVFMCTECTERMRTVERSAFTCPLCRTVIDGAVLQGSDESVPSALSSCTASSSATIT